jgi:hypothetical protein
MSGSRSRRKGRSIVNTLKVGGVAVRVPLSGAVGRRLADGSATPCLGKENGAPR